MDKKLIISVLLASFVTHTNAQNTAEWLRQKRTQNRYSLEQVLAANVYTDYIKKGYDVLAAGLAAVAGSKRSELEGHRTFFERVRMGMIRAIPVSYEQKFKRINLRISYNLRLAAKLTENGALGASEKQYFRGIFSRINLDRIRREEKLKTVLSASEPAMNDHQRINFLDRCLAEMESEFAFSKTIVMDLDALIAARGAQKREYDRLNRLLLGKEVVDEN
ncbi:hypothetical protein [Sphingobacterium hotanense]|uniref:hypothetical protein n=1 Tax=Sphingobacterium hotanense TaxID=649196 RepID=UPI0021A78B6C|nr:hypothetical protein [Sphingobacterium hotanense]MCT1524702.1 hypothetical protein [Sphingobacterium hotanense]